jgi:hypothetical protein
VHHCAWCVVLCASHVCSGGMCIHSFGIHFLCCAQSLRMVCWLRSLGPILSSLCLWMQSGFCECPSSHCASVVLVTWSFHHADHARALLPPSLCCSGFETRSDDAGRLLGWARCRCRSRCRGWCWCWARVPWSPGPPRGVQATPGGGVVSAVHAGAEAVTCAGESGCRDARLRCFGD